MKSLEKLKSTPNLLIRGYERDGGFGVIYKDGRAWASVIWSYGGGWEHVSIAPYRKHIVPSWEDMCRLKDMFFYDDECCVQYHPPKSEYVNNVPNCLHIWKPLDEVMPMPPSIMVGVKRGQTPYEVRKAAEKIMQE